MGEPQVLLVVGLAVGLAGYLVGRWRVARRLAAHDEVWRKRLSQAESSLRARSQRMQQLEGEITDLAGRLGLKEAELGRRRAEMLQVEQELQSSRATLEAAQDELLAARKAGERQARELADVRVHLVESYRATEQLQARAAAGESITGRFEQRLRELEETRKRLQHLDAVVEQLSAQAALVPLRERRIRELEVALAAERDRRPPGGIDDLKLIRGVGPALERMLHAEGIRSYRQIAAWSEADIERMAGRLQRFGGRIRKDDWVGQAAVAHRQKYGESLPTGPGGTPAGLADPSG